MHIREVLIRWYKSFNYDYELKAHPESSRKAWQETPDGWLPHVRIDLERDITAVVGANESGKSHLLDVINIVLTGKGLTQSDFCRYSNLFSVEQGQRLFPEVGALFILDDDDTAALTNSGVPLLENGDLLMLRSSPDVMVVVDSKDVRQELADAQRAAVQARLPYAYQLKTQVDLPDSVSIADLAQTDHRIAGRKRRLEVLTLLGGVTTAEEITGKAQALVGLLSKPEILENEQQQLGRLLLRKVARIEASAFKDLQEAIAGEREGLVNALIQEMNTSIARHLNVAKWWSQDEDFQLRVSPREHELVFTIRDRTGTDYSFSERSRGLTYFLSYYVQLRSHDRPLDRPEILLMDEPDAYLSALGQQDLMRVLEDHARPEDSDRLDQVVYVTHSPFLINRNAGHRVRVVDKGSRNEGTRLVKDVTQNHYEPLRTSLGASVAETAFIGGTNLFVEGISDQVLLVGMNARLRRLGTPPSQCLDLNEVTLVPGGSNIPYMLYLARGRDQHKPACAVLLDSDVAGQTAKAAIKKGGARNKPTVPDDLIVMIGEWASANSVEAADGVDVKEPEDLVPLVLAGVAARRYARSLLGLSKTQAAKLSDKAIHAGLAELDGSMWDAVEAAFASAFKTNIGKAGFAKELLAHINVGASEADDEEDRDQEAIATFDRNFAKLVHQLTSVLRRAAEREVDVKRDQRVERIIGEFIADHPAGCVRDRASIMLDRIDSAADNSVGGDVIRAGTSALRRDFALQVNPLDRIAEYDRFTERLKNIPILVRLRDQGRLDAADVISAAAEGVSVAQPEQASEMSAE